MPLSVSLWSDLSDPVFDHRVGIVIESSFQGNHREQKFRTR